MLNKRKNDYNHVKLEVAIALSAVAAVSSIAGLVFGGANTNENQIFDALVKMEALKAGGIENRNKVKELYSSNEFKSQQAQAIDAALQKIGSNPQQPNQAATQQPTTTEQTLSQEQITAIKANAYIDGSKDAKIIIVEYTDPECPFCIRHFKDNTIKTAMDSDKANVAHIMKPVQGVNHPGTEFKSLAMLCAGKLKGQEGYYKAFNDIMTASITAVPTNEETISIIEKAGIKKADLEKCMAEPDIKAIYAANRAEAQGLGQSGTPGNLIINTENGKYVALAGAYPSSEFISALTKIK